MKQMKLREYTYSKMFSTNKNNRDLDLYDYDYKYCINNVSILCFLDPLPTYVS